MTRRRKTKAQLIDGDVVLYIDNQGHTRPALLVERRDEIGLLWTIKTLDTGREMHVDRDWVVPL